MSIKVRGKTVYGPNIVTNGLQLLLDAANPRSYPGAGYSWYDMSNNGNNGSINGSPTFSSGNLFFNGTDYMTVNSLGNTNFPQSAGTIGFWYNVPTTATGSVNYSSVGIFDSYDISRNHIYIRNYFNPPTNMQITFQAGPTAGTYLFNSNLIITPNIWNYICVTYLTGSSSLVSTYVNGMIQSSGSLSSSTWTPNQQVVGFVSAVNNPCMNGYYSILHVYNRALSQSEITQNYNAIKSRYKIT